MYDAKKIIPGIVLFLGILSFPVWYGRVSGAREMATPVLAPGHGACVESKDFMRSSHMVLLNEWRDSVIRDGNRMKVSAGGKSFDRSLTGACMSCHVNKKEFCDRCHGDMNVTPTCWECHNAPEESAHAVK